MSRESPRRAPETSRMQLVGIGKDPNDMGTSANLLVEALKHVGRFHVFAVGERRAEVGQGLFDVVLDPAGEPGIFSALFSEPSRKIAPDLREIAPIIHPAQLQQAVVADCGNVIECVPEDLHYGHGGPCSSFEW